jgi:parvulin-like peptidyl-prolyl isomerase
MIRALLPLLLALPAASAAPADPELVRVNGVAIRRSEVVERLLKRFGAQAVDEMVDELLLRQAAAAQKVTAPEDEIERRLARVRSQFGSPELFLSQLEQAGTSVSRLKEEIGDEVVRERLIVKAQGLKVSDDELKKAFDENKDKLGTPPAVHLRHILVKEEKQAQELVEKIKKGAEFAPLAREHSLAASGKAAGGDYGFVSRGMLPPEIDEIAFSLKPGELRVVPGPRGQHILQALAARPAKPAVFGEIKEELRELLLSEKIKKAAPAYLHELRRKADIAAPGAPAPSPKR